LPIYDLGDGVNLRHIVYDRDGNLTDASVSLGVIKPDLTTDPVTVTRTSLGHYDGNTYVPTLVGDYTYKWTISGAVTDVATGYFKVADPAPSLYCSLPQVKAQLGKETEDERDDLIELAIRSASRKIDQLTGRRFYADTVATARVFPLSQRLFASPYGQAVRVDDISSLTGMLVGGGTAGGSYTTISAYFVGPDNALVLGQPITYIQADTLVYTGINSIQVTARWGWPTVPDEVESACVLLAARLYRRKDSPQGVISSADWGSVRVSRVDPDVEALLSHLILPGFA
jgi:hypothetical protein